MAALGGRLQAGCTLVTEAGCRVGWQAMRERKGSARSKAKDTGHYSKKNAGEN